MSRLIILIVFIVLFVGGLFYLSTVPEEQPTRTIEADVAPGGNAT